MARSTESTPQKPQMRRPRRLAKPTAKKTRTTLKAKPVVSKARRGPIPKIDPDVVPALNDLARDLRSGPISRQIWRQVLSEQERQQISNNELSDTDILRNFAHLKQISEERAVIELAHELGRLGEPEYRRWLRDIGEAILHVPENNARPEWSRDTCKLAWRGEVIQTVRGPKVAKNVALVLDVFQEEGWPHRLDDPLPGSDNKQRLHETIKSLNRGLRRIRFRADGTGEGFVWELAET